MARFGLSSSSSDESDNNSDSDQGGNDGKSYCSTTATPPPPPIRTRTRSTAAKDDNSSNSSHQEEEDDYDKDIMQDEDDDDDDLDAPPRTSLAHSNQGDNDDEDDDDDTEQSDDEQMHSTQRSNRNNKVNTSRGRLSTSHSTLSSSPPQHQQQLDSTKRNRSIRQQPPASTTQQPWAAKLHLEPKRVAVMQASFFQQQQSIQTQSDSGFDDRRVKAVPSGLFANNSSSKLVVPTAGSPFVNRTTAPTPVPAPPIDPTPFRAYRHYKRVDLNQSVISGQEGNLVDLGLALGRSFRVNWGPKGEIVHLGKGLYATQASTTRSDTLQIDKFKSEQSFDKEAALRNLRLQLKYTPIYPANSTSAAPVAVTESNLRFRHFASSLASSDRSAEANLWRLGHALFDEIEDLETHSLGAEQADPTQCRYIEDIRRRALLEQWLADVVRTEVEDDLRKVADSSSSSTSREPLSSAGAQRIFALLSGHQIERACDAALEAGDLRLATLVAQAGGDDAFREDVYLQLAKWREYRVDSHISPAIRRVYELLCGNVGQSEGRQAGDRADDVAPLHVAEGMSWRRAFGLHLWYGTWQTPLSTAVKRYEAAYSSEPQVARPLPGYLVDSSKQGTNEVIWRNLDSDPTSSPTDPLFQLIKLFTSPTHSLEQALLPRNFSSSPLDYRLPWHLYILFSRVLRRRDFEDRLEVNTEDHPTRDNVMDDDDAGPAVVEGNSVTADRVTESFASQLEHNGLWQWAVFVLLHLELPDRREKAVRELLSRKATLIDQEQFTFLVEKLKIPETWIYFAQASFEHYSGAVFSEYKLLLAAERYSDAHQIVVVELAPEAIIRSDAALLRRLFEPFEPSTVADWNEGAQIYLDYVLCLEQQSRYQSQSKRQQPDGFPQDDESSDPHHAHLVRTLEAVHKLSSRTSLLSRHVKLKVAVAEMHSRLTVLAQAQGGGSSSGGGGRVQPSKMQEADRSVWLQGANSSFLANSIEAACA